MPFLGLLRFSWLFLVLPRFSCETFLLAASGNAPRSVASTFGAQAPGQDEVSKAGPGPSRGQQASSS